LCRILHIQKVKEKWFMRAFVWVVATIVTLFIASTASAVLPAVQYKEYPTDSTDPTVRSCVAYGAYGQRCKRCSPTFNEDGTVAKWTCVNVQNSNNFCTCGDMSRGGCSPKGLCTYV
jgi:hypothetical protein